MQKPMKALATLTRATLYAAVAIVVAACSGDVTNPSSKQLAPHNPNDALVGIVDGVYTVTIYPSQAYTLPLGASYMTLPANAICKLGTSGYGPSYWNAPCTPETNPVTITAVVRDAQTDHPRVDFSPALRFNPNTTVSLHIGVSNAATADYLAVMKYCSGVLFSSCVDESIADPSLTTYIDHANSYVYRRIKHFSGYLIAE